MNGSSDIAGDTGLRAQEAADWLLRLREPALPDETIEAWQRWMDADPANARAFDRVGELWELAGALDWTEVETARAAATGQTPVQVAPAATAVRPRAPRRRAAWPRWTGLAAALGLLAVLAGGLLPQHRPSAAAVDSRRLATAIGEHRRIDLADGSVLELGAASEIHVRFDRDLRQLDLIRGVADFAVAHDADRPFEVQADASTTRAIGTRFSVVRRPQGIAVTVSEGVVQVQDRQPASPAGGVRLGRGEQVVLTPGTGLGAPARVDPHLAVSWLDAAMVYRAEPLENIVADLNRYSAVPIELRDPALRALPVTGRWGLDDVDAWLDGVARALSLNVVRTPGRILLVPAASRAAGGAG